MDTIRKLLKQGLISDHYNLAEKYSDFGWYNWDIENSDISSTHGALGQAFDWSASSEGYDFWEEIYLQLRDGYYVKHSKNIFKKIELWD